MLLSFLLQQYGNPVAANFAVEVLLSWHMRTFVPSQSNDIAMGRIAVNESAEEMSLLQYYLLVISNVQAYSVSLEARQQFLMRAYHFTALYTLSLLRVPCKSLLAAREFILLKI